MQSGRKQGLKKNLEDLPPPVDVGAVPEDDSVAVEDEVADFARADGGQHLQEVRILFFARAIYFCFVF
jgi:hypothetical protein